MPTVSVTLNRDGLNTVETDTKTVQAETSVDIILENHGKPSHVHLHPDDDLAVLGSVDASHLFVPEGEFREATLQLSPGATGEGRLDITIGYGQARTRIDIVVTKAEEPSGKVDTKTSSTGKPNTMRDSDSTVVLPAITDRVGTPNPVVLGAGGAFLGFVLFLLFIDPLAATSALLAGLLMGVAVGSHLSDWNPFSETRDEQ